MYVFNIYIDMTDNDVATALNQRLQQTRQDIQNLQVLERHQFDNLQKVSATNTTDSSQIQERIKKLVEAGVIKGFHANIDPKMLGLDVSAIITIISESSEHYKDVIDLAKDSSEVIQCFSTTGKGSHTLIVIAKNSQALEELLRKIQSWPGVSRTETQVILSSYDINKNSYQIK